MIDMTYCVYTFEDENGQEDVYTTTNALEAKSRGRQFNLKVYENHFDFVDSEVVWDFTRKDSDE